MGLADSCVRRRNVAVFLSRDFCFPFFGFFLSPPRRSFVSSVYNRETSGENIPFCKKIEKHANLESFVWRNSCDLFLFFSCVCVCVSFSFFKCSTIVKSRVMKFDQRNASVFEKTSRREINRSVTLGQDTRVDVSARDMISFSFFLFNSTVFFPRRSCKTHPRKMTVCEKRKLQDFSPLFASVIVQWSSMSSCSWGIVASWKFSSFIFAWWRGLAVRGQQEESGKITKRNETKRRLAGDRGGRGPISIDRIDVQRETVWHRRRYWRSWVTRVNLVGRWN